MNREIKFRAWQRYHERMLKVTGFQFDQYGTLESVSTFRENQMPESIIYSRFYDDFYLYINEVPTLILMQYTGLKDKNGVEIYEGDFVRVTLSSYETFGGYVKWFGDDNYPAFDLHQVNEAFYFDSNILSTVMNDGSEVEVIGNIYENPEFLKEDTNEQIQG